MKFLLTMVILTAGLNASANETLRGEWCKTYDDFTNILLIDYDGGYLSGIVGNEALEVSFVKRGSVSMGASGAFMEPSILGKNMSLVEAKRTGFFKGKLKLNFENTKDELDTESVTYKKCRGKNKKAINKLIRSLSQ